MPGFAQTGGHQIPRSRRSLKDAIATGRGVRSGVPRATASAVQPQTGQARLLLARVQFGPGGSSALALVISGCAGPQSALDPAGEGASRIAELFWVMTGASVLIWSGVVGLAIYAMYFRSSPIDARTGRQLIIGGGVIFPVILLAALLTVGLSMLPGLLAPAPAGALRVQVTGYQWWWQVRYFPEGSAPFEVANELHLPVGQPVELELNGRDVIHSFWIPSIGGKVDMIPGRQTRLRLQPTRTGVFQGACAEYCGASHAQMRLVLVVDEPAAFAEWMAAQSGVAPASAQRGGELFLANGCGGCHTIRGTEARGVIGPDLTHLGSRLTIGAGVLENSAEAIRRFIADPAAIKPGALMPAFGMLPDEELRAIATYLAERR